ncbi:MAG TPA: DUF4157 domain-containing protein [Verrucomicrobiae bacterium]|jgi:hypothetical protein|nr:DUF4157 domain-containing protein [Verrucomicrobiae bacterium]
MTHALPSAKSAKTASKVASSNLRVGEANDAFEREADSAADQIMAGSAGAADWALADVSIGTRLQRKCACGGSGECEECKDKETLHRKASGDAPANGVPPVVHSVLNSPGRPLDHSAQSFFGNRFGRDFGNVRIHTDSTAAESASSVNALAYTVGNHVVFGHGQFAPSTHEGGHLLAHELSHVIQQENGAVPALRRQSKPQPQPKAPPKPVPPVAPTKQQKVLIDEALRAAAIRAQLALFQVRGAVDPGPENRGDRTIESRWRAQELAKVMFQWDKPNMDQVEQVVSSMVNILTPGPDVKVAGANDRECGDRAAYVRGLQPPVVLCPAFFSGCAEERVRTMIHESAHLARIGSASLGESYCVVFDCHNSCGGFDSADSWAQFVHCLSGQMPDTPTTITAPAGGGQKGQPSGQKGQTPVQKDLGKNVHDAATQAVQKVESTTAKTDQTPAKSDEDPPEGKRDRQLAAGFAAQTNPGQAGGMVQGAWQKKNLLYSKPRRFLKFFEGQVGILQPTFTFQLAHLAPLDPGSPSATSPLPPPDTAQLGASFAPAILKIGDFTITPQIGVADAVAGDVFGTAKGPGKSGLHDQILGVVNLQVDYALSKKWSLTGSVGEQGGWDFGPKGTQGTDATTVSVVATYHLF